MAETKRCEIGEQLENRFLLAVHAKINGQKKETVPAPRELYVLNKLIH